MPSNEHLRLRAFALWLVCLDEPIGPGAEARRTITLNQIIARAREALGPAEYSRDQPPGDVPDGVEGRPLGRTRNRESA